MQAEPLVDTLVQVVAELEGEALGATLGYLEPEAPVDTLGDIWRGSGRDCWRDTKEVKAKALDYT